MRTRLALIVAIYALAPGIALAAWPVSGQCSSAFQNFPCFAQVIINLLGAGTAALVGIAIVMYFWGIVQQLWGVSGGNAKSFESIRTQLIWGFVGLFVIFSIWGIISLLGQALFGTNNFNSLF